MASEHEQEKTSGREQENQHELDALKQAVKTITDENNAIKAELAEMRKTIARLIMQSGDEKYRNIKNEMKEGTLGATLPTVGTKSKGWR